MTHKRHPHYQWEQVEILPGSTTGQVCWSVAPGDGVVLVNGGAGRGDSFGLAVSGTAFGAPIVACSWEGTICGLFQSYSGMCVFMC